MCRDGVGKQQIVDLLFQPRGAAVFAGDPVDIDDLVRRIDMTLNVDGQLL